MIRLKQTYFPGIINCIFKTKYFQYQSRQSRMACNWCSACLGNGGSSLEVTAQQINIRNDRCFKTMLLNNTIQILNVLPNPHCISLKNMIQLSTQIFCDQATQQDAPDSEEIAYDMLYLRGNLRSLYCVECGVSGGDFSPVFYGLYMNEECLSSFTQVIQGNQVTEGKTGILILVGYVLRNKISRVLYCSAAIRTQQNVVREYMGKPQVWGKI